jgi:chemotaxis protein MotB
MKSTRILVLATLTMTIGSGCVSRGEYREAQAEAEQLSFKLNAAERHLASKRARLDTLEQEKKNLAAQIGTLEQRVTNSGHELVSVREQLDAEYKSKIAELQQSVPEIEVSEYGGLVLESGVFFTPGHHQLRVAGKKILDSLCERFASDEYSAYTLEVAGHTDSDPIRKSKGRYTDNHILAASRANAVRRYLLTKGIDEQRLFLSAWGSLRPLGDRANKARNRRVEILLHREDLTTTLPASAPR